MSALVEDLSVFFSGEFSETVEIEGVEVDGIFEEGFASVDSIDGSSPVFSTATTSLPAVANGSSLVRTETGVSYTIREIEDSGDGVTLLRLYKVG